MQETLQCLLSAEIRVRNAGTNRRNPHRLMGICETLIEMSPNGEKGINLTELFNGLPKERRDNMQEMCSHLAVKSPWESIEQP